MTSDHAASKLSAVQLGATNPQISSKSVKQFSEQLKKEQREAEDRAREKNIREKQMKELAAMLSSSESETEEAPVNNLPPLPEIQNIEQPETIFVDLTADSDDETETAASEGNPDLIIISDSDEF